MRYATAQVRLSRLHGVRLLLTKPLYSMLLHELNLYALYTGALCPAAWSASGARNRHPRARRELVRVLQLLTKPVC